MNQRGYMNNGLYFRNSGSIKFGIRKKRFDIFEK